jgi:hypothetical protein
MNDEILDFDQISDALARLNADIDAPELHGTLSGLLCVMGNTASKHLEQLIPKGAKGDALDKEAYDIISACPNIILAELNDPEFSYLPLLPDDDEDLQYRTEAMSEWSQGFLMGLAMAGIKDYDKLPKESSEFCQDLLEISQASHGNGEVSEEDESAYYELVEYLRVGVLLIYEMLNPVTQDGAPSTQIH